MCNRCFYVLTVMLCRYQSVTVTPVTVTFLHAVELLQSYTAIVVCYQTCCKLLQC
jgi:hypothetical protein